MEKGEQGGATVLVVDDDDVVTKVRDDGVDPSWISCFSRKQLLQKWMEEAGYKCVVAQNAEQAWKDLQNLLNNVSVVIADVVMPGEFDGIGLLDRVGTLGKGAASVILISGKGGNSASEGVKHGSHDFMAKPLDRHVLLRKVELLIQHRRLERQLESDRDEKAVMKKEIDKLSQHVLRTPAQSVINLVVALLGSPSLTPDLREKVESLHKLILQHSNLYRPTPLEHVAPNLDPVTRSFLLNELLLSEPLSSSDFGHDFKFPDVHLDDPLVKELTQWTFDVFKYREDELLGLVKQMFVELDLLSDFGIRPEALEKFLGAIKQLYKDNPYHNWVHAFDVTQATFCVLVRFGGQAILSRLDMLALLVSALCHDLGHPGVNNAHLVMTQADLALLYNDQSVLENFHVASFFRLLHDRKDLNILASLSKAQYKEVRKAITECILATDMASHLEYVAKLGVKGEHGRSKWNFSDTEERLLFMKCIIKLADISNVARPWSVSVKWSKLVSEEFFAQGCFVSILLCSFLIFFSNQGTWRDRWDKRLLRSWIEVLQPLPLIASTLLISSRCHSSRILGN
jgi:FixJ family two-component response regulator